MPTSAMHLCSYHTRQINIKHMPSIATAGKDFVTGSLTLRCMAMAPSIKRASKLAAGKTNQLNQIPMSKASAQLIFIAPIT